MYNQPIFTQDVFSTKRFTVRFEALPEYDLDLSWDENGETAAALDVGEAVAFCAKVSVILDGYEIACNYLGQCIYNSFEEFTTKYKHDYFADMLRETIREARAEIMARDPLPYIRAA